MPVPCYLAKCPYYIHDDKNKIRCACVDPVKYADLTFSDAEAAKKWRKKYCHEFDGHLDCPVALTIKFEFDIHSESDGQAEKKEDQD